MALLSLSVITLFVVCWSFRTLLAGGTGSLLEDRYSWESMFYGVGFLSALWALIVWQFLLKGTVTIHLSLKWIDYGGGLL